MHRHVSWISDARFAPYLEECEGDEHLAWELYEWNARIAGALFEVFHHAEVLLRNAMVLELEKLHPWDYPWRDRDDLDSVGKAVAKLRKNSAEVTPDGIIAQMSLGYWARLFDAKPIENEELWRSCLSNSFPGSPGTRKAVFRVLSDMRELRNRCAHADSLLSTDPAIELKKILVLTEWIDPRASQWITRLERVSEIAQQRPVAVKRDVLVVPVLKDTGLEMYERVQAYVCPQGRNFQKVTRLGFYWEKKIDPRFPKVIDHLIPSQWSKDAARQLQNSNDSSDRHLARVMGFALKKGWSASEGPYQVYLLSSPDSSETSKRVDDTAIPHLGEGRGNAFVHRHRYFSLPALLNAVNTNDLNT